MSRFILNSNRFDTYKNFKFRVSFEGKPIGGASKISLSARPVNIKTKKKMPGLRKSSNVTMKRGVFKQTKFYKWIAAIPGSKNFPMNILIEQFDEKDRLVASYQLIKAWLNKIEGPRLSAEGNEVEIESLEISYEGLKYNNPKRVRKKY